MNFKNKIYMTVGKIFKKSFNWVVAQLSSFIGSLTIFKWKKCPKLNFFNLCFICFFIVTIIQDCLWTVWVRILRLVPNERYFQAPEAYVLCEFCFAFATSKFFKVHSIFFGYLIFGRLFSTYQLWSNADGKQIKLQSWATTQIKDFLCIL